MCMGQPVPRVRIPPSPPTTSPDEETNKDRTGAGSVLLLAAGWRAHERSLTGGPDRPTSAGRSSLGTADRLLQGVGEGARRLRAEYPGGLHAAARSTLHDRVRHPRDAVAGRQRGELVGLYALGRNAGVGHGE